MTQLEFNNFINMYNKKAGEYTEDEIYEICLEFKKMKDTDKNWKALISTLGINKTVDSLRCWVNRKIKKDELVKNSVRDLNGKIRKETTEDELNKNIDAQIRRNYIQEKKTRDTLNAYRRQVTDTARIEELKESITNTVDKLNKLPKISCNSKAEVSDREAVLMISDLHIGADVDNFYNKYNVEIATKRLNKLVDDTIKYCHLYNVKTLHVLNMGDLIHGLIHISARLEQTNDTVEQVMIAAELLSNALNKLQNAAPNITYRSVVDNHSRIVANKNEHIEKDNLGRLIDWYVKERMKNSDIVFMNDNIDVGIGKFKIQNKTIVFAHGHQDTINGMFQAMTGATREFVDYALLAHYHSEKVKAYQGFKVIVNGSIIGSDSYALSKRLFGKPSQTLLVFENGNLSTISIDLDII